MKRLTKIIIVTAVIFSLIVGLSLFFVKNINKSNNKITKNSKYMIVGKQNLIAVYEDKLAIKIPFDIQIEKDLTIGDMADRKDYSKILEVMNRIFPERIDTYKVIKLGSVDIRVKNAINIPETSINDKRYILTSSINGVFQELYKKTTDTPFEDVVIDVLNANGKAGYSRKIGEKLKSKFKLNYNAATYEKKVGGSYVIINNLPKEKVEEIVEALDEKYIKIKEIPSVPSVANLVLILGEESTSNIEIKIFGNKDRGEEVNSILKENEYSKVEIKDTDEKNNDETIEYSEENYYVAYKIGKKLDIKKLVENNELGNIIKINVK
ncbi:MAG: LytR C-terminal domain-containing protein [Fusobacteriaceae bacterium]